MGSIGLGVHRGKGFVAGGCVIQLLRNSSGIFQDWQMRSGVLSCRGLIRALGSMVKK